MKKFIYPVLASALFLTACGEVSHAKQNKTMFQSVQKEKAQLLQDGKNKHYCLKCGMDLVKFYKTSHAASSEKKDKTHQYCSIHCLEDHLGDGIVLKNPRVVDVSSLEFISVSDATYVVGSNVHGTMSRVSKYAFLNKKDALEFQKKYGGEIMDFNSALEKAKEDFKHYR